MIVPGFQVKEGLGCLLFWAVLAWKTHNLALPWRENPIHWMVCYPPCFVLIIYSIARCCLVVIFLPLLQVLTNIKQWAVWTNFLAGPLDDFPSFMSFPEGWKGSPSGIVTYGIILVNPNKKRAWWNSLPIIVDPNTKRAWRISGTASKMQVVFC